MLGTILDTCPFMAYPAAGVASGADGKLMSSSEGNNIVSAAASVGCHDFPSIAVMSSQRGAAFLGQRHNAARRIATLCIAAGVPCSLLQSCVNFMDSCRWAGIVGTTSNSHSSCSLAGAASSIDHST